MEIASLKFKGYRCFEDQWSDIGSFSPINVVIGRNNTGKSHLLDVVEQLTQAGLKKSQITCECSSTFDEASLRKAFPEGVQGGELGNYWAHGRQFVNKAVCWEVTAEKTSFTEDANRTLASAARHGYHPEVRRILLDAAARLQIPWFGRSMRRLLADRDVQPERLTSDLNVDPNGRGATHVIQRHITNEKLDEDLIQVTLLKHLAEIFGDDGQFNRIEIRQTGEVGIAPDQAMWEVFLGEPVKGLVPLSRSGSGLKTIILVLLNLLVIPQIENKSPSQYIFAFEELENNLHPALLRRLFRFLADFVVREKCILFLTTHSSVAVDFFSSRSDAQIIQVTHDGKFAQARPVRAHFDKVQLLSELGCRPSDLLQANGIIWVEGPSDRIYINRFLAIYSEDKLQEGRDYQCAFYGGSVLKQCEFTDPDESNGELANLLRLNANVAVLCDGDRLSETDDELKARVQRVSDEVVKIPNGFLWVTEAKEIENYIPGTVWAKIYDKEFVSDPDKFDSFPSKVSEGSFVFDKLGRKTFDKCEFATEAAPLLTKELMEGRFEFDNKLKELVERVRSWNA